jgi:hypothetical protein
MAIYFFIFSFERTFKTICNTLLPFFHILLTSTNILIERNEMSAIFIFCRYACHVTTGVTQYSKLYSVCPSKYQDHSKPLKHLPINIWSATNTFIWLIPVVTSPKLPLMRSKIYPRWRTSHYFK